LDVVVEAAWLQDTVTRRRSQSADGLAAYLQREQGLTATATLEAPAWAFLGGARWLFRSGRLRPYLLGEGGAARVTFRPAITIAGSDVTTRLSGLGVSLGGDLTGSSVRPVVGGGVGVLMSHGRWIVDGGVRLLTIQSVDAGTNVIGAKLGIGYGF
jgi:hypothetical protein